MSTWKVHPECEYYYCTNTIVEWYPIFTESCLFNAIIESLAHCINEKGLRVHAYVIMLNHMHLIVSATATLSVSDIMRDFKRFTSMKLSTLLEEKNHRSAIELFRKAARQNKLDQDYKVWQDGFHPISIYSESFFRNKVKYIHHNPVRKGYVLEPQHWFYSSAGNYMGNSHIALEIDFLR